MSVSSAAWLGRTVTASIRLVCSVPSSVATWAFERRPLGRGGRRRGQQDRRDGRLIPLGEGDDRRLLDLDGQDLRGGDGAEHEAGFELERRRRAEGGRSGHGDLLKIHWGSQPGPRGRGPTRTQRCGRRRARRSISPRPSASSAAEVPVPRRIWRKARPRFAGRRAHPGARRPAAAIAEGKTEGSSRPLRPRLRDHRGGIPEDLPSLLHLHALGGAGLAVAVVEAVDLAGAVGVVELAEVLLQRVADRPCSGRGLTGRRAAHSAAGGVPT